MNAYVQLLAGVAMVAGAYGSMLFVDTDKEPANYPLGAQVFMFGNITNIAVGLSIGDMSMVIAQAGLCSFDHDVYLHDPAAWCSSPLSLYGLLVRHLCISSSGVWSLGNV